MAKIMFCCIILHNMIIEDERDIVQPNYEYEGSRQPPQIYRPSVDEIEGQFDMFHMDQHELYRNSALHNQLQQDLMVHI